MPDTHLVLRRFLQYAKGIAFWLRDRSFKAVGQSSERITDEILELLNDPDIDVVSGALVMAGESSEPRVIEALIHFLGRTELDWWVRLTAVETLHRFRDPRVTPALRRCLDEEELRNSALACLAQRRDPEALPMVVEYMRHDRRGMRLAALQAAVHYEEPRFLPVIEHVAIHDEDEDVRVLALEVLDGYGAEGVAIAASIRETRRKQQQAAMGDIGLTMESNLMD